LAFCIVHHCVHLNMDGYLVAGSENSVTLVDCPDGGNREKTSI